MPLFHCEAFTVVAMHMYIRKCVVIAKNKIFLKTSVEHPIQHFMFNVITTQSKRSVPDQN